MDLRTGCSLWQGLQPHKQIYSALKSNLECETLIIGGGVTGALLSYILSKEGISNVLIDKRNPGTGSTAASTGLLQYEIDTSLVDLIKKIGQEQAVHAYRRGVKAIDEIEEILSTLDGHFDFKRRDSLYLASDESDLAALQEEYACRKEFKFPVSYLSHNQIAARSSLKAPAAILSQNDAQVNPLEMTNRLLTAAKAMGANIFGESKLLAMQNQPGYIEAVTDGGLIEAKNVVFATGYEACEQLRNPPGKLLSTYAVASQPVEHFAGWPDGALIWETARPYFYARQTSQNQIIIGGGDTNYAEDHAEPHVVQQKAAVLQQKFHTMFPGINFVPACAWGGTFAETADGLAMIGKVPRTDRCYAALGYGGNGITFSMIAAKLIRDLILKRPNNDEKVFRFERFGE